MERLVINTKDLNNNINIVKQYVKNNNSTKNIPKIIGVVKGNGYGLGLIELSKELIYNGIYILAVAKLDEALELKNNNINTDILLLTSTCIEDEIKQIIENDIIPTVGSINSLIKYNKMAVELNKKINVHLMIETGFGRTGIKYNEINKFENEYKKCENINIVGMYTHFAASFLEERTNVDEQYKQFMKVVDKLREKDIKADMLHICNSSAVFKYPEYYLDAVRVGSAFLGRLANKNNYGLKKIGILESDISEVETIEKGNNIGYGKRYIAKKDLQIAIVPVGYSSGVEVQVLDNNNTFMDNLRNTYHSVKKFFVKPRKNVLINNREYEIISGIRMDNIILDVTGTNIKPGDVIKIDTNPVLIDSRVERRYL